jgi:hypothetical protein
MKISDKDFDNALTAIVKEHTSESLMTIPGIYEILSEHFNNEAIERAEEEKRDTRRGHLLEVVKRGRGNIQ